MPTIDIQLPEPQPVTVDIRDAVLVVVDMENEFLDPQGISYLARGRRAIEPTVALIDAFRSRQGRIIFLRSVRSEDALEHTVFGRKQHLIEGSWGVELTPPLAAAPEDIVIAKHSHDCFNGTALESVVQEQGLQPGRSQIVVCGVATNVCVDCAVVGFSVRDYRVVVPMDATAANSEVEEWVAYQHFCGPAYRHNVTLTASNRITWQG